MHADRQHVEAEQRLRKIIVTSRISLYASGGYTHEPGGRGLRALTGNGGPRITRDASLC